MVLATATARLAKNASTTVREIFAIGTIFRSREGNGKYLVADISGSGKPTHWVNLLTGSLGAMQDYDLRAFADSDNWEVVPNAG